MSLTKEQALAHLQSIIETAYDSDIDAIAWLCEEVHSYIEEHTIDDGQKQTINHLSRELRAKFDSTTALSKVDEGDLIDELEVRLFQYASLPAGSLCENIEGVIAKYKGREEF